MEFYLVPPKSQSQTNASAPPAESSSSIQTTNNTGDVAALDTDDSLAGDRSDRNIVAAQQQKPGEKMEPEKVP